MNITTIVIKKDTRTALKKIGLKGETYDQIISKLIKLRKSEPSMVRNGREDI